MKRIVPNVGPVGSDLCLDPIAINIPLMLIDNGLDCFWYPHLLDQERAKQVEFLLGNSSENEVISLSVDLILPSAYTLCSVTRRLHSLSCDPVRATIVAGGRDN